jgi:5-amino-6-(5-phosphoribosylamino)uracil reductase
VNHTPYVILSCAMSVDGYIDDASPARLLLSNAADFDRVDALRAECDAILIGARTIRRDNPSLELRSAHRSAARVRSGLPAHPVKVAVTSRGGLDPAARFFHTGGDRLIYCGRSAAEDLRSRLGELAEVVAFDPPLNLPSLLDDLSARGVRRLLVEGGSTVHTQLLLAGLVDEMRLAIAPFLVGDPAAPRFVAPGRFPHSSERRMRLAEVSQVGDVAVVRYLLDRGPVG